MDIQSMLSPRSHACDVSPLDEQQSPTAGKPLAQSENVFKRRCLRQNSDSSQASTGTNFSDESFSTPADVTYGIKTLQGARPAMEDIAVAQSILLPAHEEAQCQASCLEFYAVYDGHGGAHVARHCAATLHGQFVELLGPSPSVATVQHSLEASFRMVNDSLDKTASQLSGSTAAVAVVAPTRIWTANCGDSRIVLARRGVALPLTSDHSLDREDEAMRVTRCGGQVLWKGGCGRVNGLLAMSRALGDFSLAPYGVTAEPEVACWTRSPHDQFLIIASDGLWSIISNQEAVDLAAYSLQRAAARGKSRSAAARVTAGVLAKMAIEKGSTDNVSVVFVDLSEGGAVVGLEDSLADLCDGEGVEGGAAGQGAEAERDAEAGVGRGEGGWGVRLQPQDSVMVLEAHLEEQRRQRERQQRQQQQRRQQAGAGLGGVQPGSTQQPSTQQQPQQPSSQKQPQEVAVAAPLPAAADAAAAAAGSSALGCDAGSTSAAAAPAMVASA